MSASTILVELIAHRDGVPWNHAPRPRRLFHRHEPWTTCPCAEGYEIHRCACGALRYTDIPGWSKRGRPRFRGLLRSKPA